MAREEKIALDKVQVVFVHEGERYQVATPWKHEHPALLINYEMACSCLRNTEKGFHLPALTGRRLSEPYHILPRKVLHL